MSTRLAGEKESVRLQKDGYVSYPSEVGNVFLSDKGFTASDTLTFGMSKFLWMDQITVKGLRVN